MNLSLLKYSLFFSIALLFGCTHSKVITSDANQKNTNKIPLSYSETRKLDIAFTDGVIQKMIGNYPEAISHFKKCLDIYPNHAASMYEIAFIGNGLGKSSEAIPFAQRAVALDINNEWYRYLLAKCYMDVGQFNEASTSFERLVKMQPNNIDYYFMLTNSLLHSGKKKDALEVFDKIEQKVGISEDVILQKEKIYLSLNQLDKAVLEAQKLIASSPLETRYYRMLAELYLQNNMEDKAMETCNKIFSIDSNDPETHLLLAEYCEKKGQGDKAFSHVKSAFENPNLNIDNKVKILVNYFNIPEKFKDERIESDTLLQILLRVHPNDPKTYSLSGDFLNRDGKMKEASRDYRKAIALDKTRYPIWQQLMALDESLGDFNAMELESKEAMELFPSEPYTYIFNASANYQKKKYKEAIDVIESGKDYVVGDKKLLGQFYSILGDCYNAMKEYTLSDLNFEKTLNLDPENANVMNNWAYYLSLRNEKLDKADKMGRRANQLVKDNASYEDTYAWVLYKLKQYEEAKRWQERAIEHGGANNGTLMEHYGDILFQMGQLDKAFEYWQKAKLTGKYSDFLDKKLSDKKLIE